MKCPICGKENESGKAFCENCGTTLVEESVKTADALELPPEPFAPAAPAVPIPEKPAEPEPAPYVNTAAIREKPKPHKAPAAEVPPEKKNESAPCKPLSTWSYIWRTVFFSIPVIGIILLFVFAFARGINKNSKSFARAWLVFMLIGVIIAIACTVLCYIFREQVTSWLVQVFNLYLVS